MSEWVEVMLQDVVSVLGDGLHGTPEYDDNGEYYFINGNNLCNGKILIKENTRRANKQEFEKYKKNLNDRTILVSINGTVGNIALYNNEKCFLGKSACYFNVADSVDRNFIRYVVSTKNFQMYISEFAHGTTIKNVSLKTIREYQFLLPPISEQKTIASILASLDDKIDLLNRQNKTLEAMAETLFRQRFVEESNEGWDSKGLLEIVQLVGGGTPKTSIPEYWDGDICWLSGGDIASNHKSFVYTAEKKITDLGLNNSSTKLLPQYATVISARGTVGKYCLLAKPMAFSQSNYGIMPNIEGCFFFTYLLINHVVEELQSSAYGSVFDTITTNTFRDIKLPLPVKDVMQEFENEVTPHFKKMLLNKEQICTLEKLRNTLLPKLMSGEVKVGL